MSEWSKDPPKEPGWYWAVPMSKTLADIERYGAALPKLVRQWPEGFADSVRGRNRGGRPISDLHVSYKPVEDCRYWWGPRIEPPAWPESKP